MQFVIDPFGIVHCLYTEEIDLCSIGDLSIQRASRVEPTPDGLWTADMSPLNGPHLGPFAHRSQAIAAEVQWLEDHLLNKDT